MSRDHQLPAFPRLIGLITAVVLCGCGPSGRSSDTGPVIVPLQSPEVTFPASTPPIQTTRTIQAPSISTRTPSPTGRLLPIGPWLAYTTGDDGLFAVNKDGTGITELSCLPSALPSPFFDGSTTHPLLALITNLRPEVLQPALCVVSLPSLELQAMIPLLDCPQKLPGCVFDEQADVLREPAWSPDGRLLAFVAANDGPSTDLYIFDASTGDTSRITQGPNQVGSFQWSPDGRLIVHEEVLGFYPGGGAVQALWAVSPDGGASEWLYAPEGSANQVIIGWLDNDRFVVVDSTMDGNRNARVIDLATGAISSLYKGYFMSESLDPASETFAFSPYVGSPGASVYESGIYYLTPSSTLPKRVDIPDISLSGWDPSLGHFVSSVECDLGQGDKGLLAFSPAGVVSCLPTLRRVSSPDGKWEIELARQIRLIDHATQRGAAIDGVGPGGLYNVLWRPDSVGFFLVSDTALHYVPVENPVPVLLEDDLLHYWQGAVKWVGKD